MTDDNKKPPAGFDPSNPIRMHDQNLNPIVDFGRAILVLCEAVLGGVNEEDMSEIDLTRDKVKLLAAMYGSRMRKVARDVAKNFGKGGGGNSQVCVEVPFVPEAVIAALVNTMSIMAQASLDGREDVVDRAALKLQAEAAQVDFTALWKIVHGEDPGQNIFRALGDPEFIEEIKKRMNPKKEAEHGQEEDSDFEAKLPKGFVMSGSKKGTTH